MDEAPTHCTKGHPFGPGLVHLSFMPCNCPGAIRRRGHRLYFCEHVVAGVRCGDMQAPGHVEPPEG